VIQVGDLDREDEGMAERVRPFVSDGRAEGKTLSHGACPC
jgi:hypothetical protein